MRTANALLRYQPIGDSPKVPVLVDGYGALKCVQYVLDMFEIHKGMNEIKELAKTEGVFVGNHVLFGQLKELFDLSGLKTDEQLFSMHDMQESLEGGNMLMTMVGVGGETHAIAVLDVNTDAKEVLLYDPAESEIPNIVTPEHFDYLWTKAGQLLIEISNR